MPQRKIKPIRNPDDFEEVQRYIEESACSGRHRNLLPLLNDKLKPIIQLPKLRSSQFEIVSYAQKEVRSEFITRSRSPRKPRYEQ